MIDIQIKEAAENLLHENEIVSGKFRTFRTNEIVSDIMLKFRESFLRLNPMFLSSCFRDSGG
jgi:hypothetical protein